MIPLHCVRCVVMGVMPIVGGAGESAGLAQHMDASRHQSSLIAGTACGPAQTYTRKARLVYGGDSRSPSHPGTSPCSGSMNFTAVAGWRYAHIRGTVHPRNPILVQMLAGGLLQPLCSWLVGQ